MESSAYSELNDFAASFSSRELALLHMVSYDKIEEIVIDISKNDSVMDFESKKYLLILLKIYVDGLEHVHKLLLKANDNCVNKIENMMEIMKFYQLCLNNLDYAAAAIENILGIHANAKWAIDDELFLSFIGGQERIDSFITSVMKEMVKFFVRTMIILENVPNGVYNDDVKYYSDLSSIDSFNIVDFLTREIMENGVKMELSAMRISIAERLALNAHVSADVRI